MRPYKLNQAPEIAQLQKEERLLVNDKAKASEAISTDDIFWRSDLYPDAAALLQHELLTVEQIKMSAVIVLDANVLLQPYEVDSKELGKEIERVYRLLAREQRIIVPGQAVREYVTNRPKKIAAVVNRIESAISRLRQNPLDKIPLLENEPSFLEIKKVIDEGKKSRSDAIALLEAMTAQVRADVSGDRIAVLYREVLAACVVDKAYSNEERETIVRELKRRQRLKIGPGFADEHKADAGIGDLLIWNEILAQGASRKTHCLFVSQETKPDWWAPEGGKFQLRPELVDEYRQASGGFCLHMVPLSALLTLFDADPGTVSELADVEARDQADVEAREQLASHWVLSKSGANNTFTRRGSLSIPIESLERDLGIKRNTRELALEGIAATQRALVEAANANRDRGPLQRRLARLHRTASNLGSQISSIEDELGEMYLSNGYETAEDE